MVTCGSDGVLPLSQLGQPARDLGRGTSMHRQPGKAPGERLPSDSQEIERSGLAHPLEQAAELFAFAGRQADAPRAGQRGSLCGV